MIPYAKPALIAVAATAIGTGGWLARGWFEDSKDLAAVEAQHALAAEIRKGQAEVSAQVEKRLSELRANERVIDRGIIREIQKPVFHNVCIPADSESFRLLNLAAQGQPARESDGQVPEKPDAAD
jgi:hypothetical protein